MKNLLGISFSLVLGIAAGPVWAAVNVFACEPEWGALAQELGGDKVSAFSGSELEVGWLPLLLTQSGNDRIQPGSPGFIEASQLVVKLEIPKVVDRSLGDIHPAGNPHVHLDPRNIAKVASVVSARLSEIDHANEAFYKERADSFGKRWQEAIPKWQQRAQPLKGVPVVVYHKDMSYFINWAGMREAGSLEPKPGIPPTPTHLAELVEQMKRNPAKVVVYSPYNDPRAAEFLGQRANIPNVMLPFTVGGTEKAKDLFGLFDDTIERLLATVK